MAILSTGNTFGATDTVTSTKLNNIADAATFDDPVDNSTLELHTDGKLRVKDSGVTKAKIENVADMKVLGNTSGSATAPQEVSILDEDDMSSDSATALATQQSIKAYVDDGDITKTTGTAPYYGCRAWGTYNGVANVLNNNGNISGVSRTATGFYTVSFSTSMPNANYAVVIGSSAAGQSGTAYNSNIKVYDKTTGSFKLEVVGSGPSGGKSNQSEISFAIFV